MSDIIESCWQATGDLQICTNFRTHIPRTTHFCTVWIPDLDARNRQRINYALENYAWRGGYSYVNIYTVLQNQVPRRKRPRIRSISMSSPGWLDLFLNFDVAVHLAKSVAVLAGSAAAATYAYRNIQKYLGDISVDRRRHQLQKLQITRAQAKEFTSMCQDMAKLLGFKNLKDLHERTGSPETSLKLLLAHYRRMSKMVEYEEKGKAKLPVEEGIEKLF